MKYKTNGFKIEDSTSPSLVKKDSLVSDMLIMQKNPWNNKQWSPTMRPPINPPKLAHIGEHKGEIH